MIWEYTLHVILLSWKHHDFLIDISYLMLVSEEGNKKRVYIFIFMVMIESNHKTSSRKKKNSVYSAYNSVSLSIIVE